MRNEEKYLPLWNGSDRFCPSLVHSTSEQCLIAWKRERSMHSQLNTCDDVQRFSFLVCASAPHSERDSRIALGNKSLLDATNMEDQRKQVRTEKEEEGLAPSCCRHIEARGASTLCEVMSNPATCKQSKIMNELPNHAQCMNRQKHATIWGEGIAALIQEHRFDLYMHASSCKTTGHHIQNASMKLETLTQLTCKEDAEHS